MGNLRQVGDAVPRPPGHTSADGDGGHHGRLIADLIAEGADMPNDAKMALVVGVGIVVAVAIVFFHKDLVNGHPGDDKPPASVVNPPAPPPAGSGNGQRNPVPARRTSLGKTVASPREHI